MNLNDIIQTAQGGQGVNNLANQFGLSPQQTQAAIQAMIPAFSTALQNMAANPAGLGGILSQLASGAHQGSFTDPTQAGSAGALGGSVLGQIFGSQDVVGKLSQQVAQASGVNVQAIQNMMPAVASILMGGLMHNMTSQGLGGIIGQLANAATSAGGLGSILGGGAAAPAAGGGLGGFLGSVLGSVMGGAQQGANVQASALQAGLNTLNSMFQAGVQVSQTHQQGLNSILQSLTNSAKG